ncbi:MAG: GNAT family N-acetyltransferase [Candidatus Lokiarchaeota archaeon]|nr:GNAT family N-acetyltransferase [Candidatus Lokiarchaeota archaeon]
MKEDLYPKDFILRNGDEVIFRHVKRKDANAVWKNFNQVVEEGIYLPVFLPVESQFEKHSWYDNLKKLNEICIVAENLNLERPNNILGQCEISNVDWDAASHVGNLGIIVRKNYRDEGIGRILIDIAIRESKKLNGKQKIILSCFSSNERALHLYRSMGFQNVGIRKKQFLINDQYYDEVLMELFIDDYIREN